MTVEQAVTLVTAGSGAIAALATLFTVNEMKRQRRAGYRPDLLVRGSSFAVYDAHPLSPGTLTVVTDPAVSLTGSTRWSGLAIVNAGFGPARHVAWQWDLTAFASLLRSLSLDMTITQEEHFVMLHGPSGGDSAHNITNQQSSAILVIPAKESDRLTFPPIYVDILARYAAAVTQVLAIDSEHDLRRSRRLARS